MSMTKEPLCPPTNRLARAGWVVLGSIALALGIIGIPLPILPTTPFLLAAAFCYARGSMRCHAWLMRNHILSAFLISGKVGMPRSLKLMMLAFVWAACLLSFLIFAREMWQQIVVLLVGIAMTAYLLLMPGVSRRTEGTSAEEDMIDIQ
jgi:uncharacterized membrane protein YbaN (DUF454 family)